MFDRDVCLHDPSCGLDLIPAIEECSTDPSGIVASFGLEAIGLLCHNDVLDFFKAWKVVQRWYPRLPDEAVLAKQWVSLLAHGHGDAQTFPDKTKKILEILWATTSHSSNKASSIFLDLCF